MGFDADQLLLAHGHRARGEYAQAKQILVALVARDPMNLEAHYLLAWVCVDTGDKQGARVEFTTVANSAPPDSDMQRETLAALGRLSR